MSLEIHPFEASYQQWAEALLKRAWGSNLVVSRGRVHDALLLPGFVAVLDGRPVGLASYHPEQGQVELVTMNSLQSGAGVGSVLLQAVKEATWNAGCRRLWLITTNDNLDALRFYQLKGFVLVAVHRNALELSRRLKPQIPLLGQHGIPLRDEIELELILEGDPAG